MCNTVPGFSPSTPPAQDRSFFSLRTGPKVPQTRQNQCVSKPKTKEKGFPLAELGPCEHAKLKPQPAGGKVRGRGRGGGRQTEKEAKMNHRQLFQAFGERFLSKLPLVSSLL